MMNGMSCPVLLIVYTPVIPFMAIVFSMVAMRKEIVASVVQ